MDNPIFGGDAPLTYRIAPIRIAGPRATEMGALRRRVAAPALMKIMTMVPMTILENLHGIASRPRGRT